MTKIEADSIPVATKIEGSEQGVSEDCGRAECGYCPAPAISTISSKLVAPSKLIPGSHWGQTHRHNNPSSVASYNIYLSVYFSSGQPAGRIEIGKIDGAERAEKFVEDFDTRQILDTYLSVVVHALVRYAGAGALIVTGKEIVRTK